MGKKILITGAGSYIGTSFENWLKQHGDNYIVDTVPTINGEWRSMDFSGYDTVLHVAGIAHVTTNPKQKDLYYGVNRDLTIEVAKQAKDNQVRQFIFMSSIIVYGSKNAEITISTQPQPDNFYGESKLQAEKGLETLGDNSFRVVILRPPMIYGKGNKGNYPLLSKIAKKCPIFPDYDNERSMLYIENLCEFIRMMIDNNEAGVFYPQNSEYVKTADLVRLIAETHGRKIKLVKIFNPLLKLMVRSKGLANKAFGSLVYDKSMSGYTVNYRVKDFRTSIYLTEGKAL